VSDVLVLSYHAVSPDWPSPLAVLPRRLEQQARWLADRGYRGVTVSDAVHRSSGAGKLVAFTFDDAYASVMQHALPILGGVGFPATVFVPTDFPARGEPMFWPGIDQWRASPHEHELRPVSWADLRQLVGQGWEVGAHSCSHPDLTQLTDARLTQELGAARERCRHELNCRCDALAYPFGKSDARVVRHVREAGYLTACTVPDDLRSRDPLLWPRIGVYRDDGLVAFRAKVSPTLRAIRSTPMADSLLPAVRKLTQRRHRSRD
jgi:peptidoglycan/xylan/chitin deacetylase (PgdA/CDA1 family)